MCGIFGCVGTRQSLSILVDGLKQLEYRGYDSAGVAYFKTNKIKIVKQVGKVENLEKKLDTTSTMTCGIAHTRWATHGNANLQNCHPHKSGKITLVHNGIIENYLELKTKINEKFYSDTDSELIAKLINKKYEKNLKNYKINNKKNKINKKIKINLLLNAISYTTDKLKGSWALEIICEDILNNIFIAKKSSPITIGYSKKLNLISSDISAINYIFNKNKISKNINYFNLNDDEFAIISQEEINFYDKNLRQISKENLKVNFSNDAVENKNFKHYMLKEICEIPSAVKKTFDYIINLKNDELLKQINDCEKITIIGCGTAYHAGLIGKFYLSNLLNKKVEVILASEFRYSKYIFSKKEIVFGISQSGETADTIAGLRLAREHKLKTVVLTNVQYSSITNVADFVLFTSAGKEVAVCATKSFNSQITAMLALALKVRSVFDNKFSLQNYLTKFEQISNIIKQEIEKDNNIDLYKQFFNKEKFFFIGKDVDATISLEGALKLKEISYVHSEGYPAGELKHGTLSLVDENSLLIATITQRNILEKTMNAVHEVKSRGAKVLLISPFELQTKGEFKIQILESDELLSPIFAIIPLQIFAYYMSINKGYDPDKPRNLAKSVTVE